MSLPPLLFVLLLVAACDRGRSDGPSPAPAPTPPAPLTPPDVPLDERIVAFRDAAAAAGFTVSEGIFEFLTYENCCLPGVICGNNPSTPYGVYRLPPAPGQTGLDVGVYPDGKARYFHLREDEALVLLGPLPPRNAYFSIRSYLAFHSSPEGDLDIIAGSLGAPFNTLSAEADLGTPEVFGTPAALVTTADAVIESEVHTLLRRSGFPPPEIHDDRITPEVVRLGTAPGDDLLMSVTRVAVIDNAAESEAWYADPDLVVLRLTPTTPRPSTAPHPLPELPQRGSGTDESAWTEALDALESAVIAEYGEFAWVKQTAIEGWSETFECIEAGSCGGDQRDRYFSRTPPFLLPGGAEFAVTIGVNHERTGKSAYSNFTVDTVEHAIGLHAVDNREMVGTARYYLPDHPQADDLFACVVARSCAGRPEPCCREVPYGCPGVEADEGVITSFRAYLERSTGAAPLHSEMLPARTIKFDVAP